jgi:hypothetical protein
MVGWAIFVIIKSILQKMVYIVITICYLLYVFKFINRDSFLGYRFEFVHMSLDYYNFN